MEKQARVRLAAWALAFVPVAALVELGAHVWQVRSAPTEADWQAVRDVALPLIHEGDLVVFAPRWTDPLGRATFGAKALSLETEAFADESRFARAVEVSTRGGHAPELAKWRKVDERRTGAFTISVLENPSYRQTLDDLVTHLTSSKTQVVAVDAAGAESPCAWSEGPGAQAGGLGFGPAIPKARFTCRGGFAGVSVVTDLDYRPRRCILAPPLGGATMRMTFHDVIFGNALHGHHGLYVEAERGKDGAPVTLVFSTAEGHLGKLTHVDGDGWKGFELPTEELAGQHGDLRVEITAPNPNRRLYCFEAITR